MTLTTTAPPPVAAPRAGRPGTLTGRVRRAGWPLAIVALVLVAVVLTYLVSGRGNGIALDPEGTGPDGARALARVVDGHGVPVQIVRSDAELADANTADASATVVVSQTGLLGDGDVDALRHLRPGGGALVLVTPTQRQLDALATGVREVGPAATRVTAPGCDIPAAQAAGRADAGGFTYAVDSGPPATGCYRVGGHPSYVVQSGPRTTVVIGQPRVLTNAHLAQEGNAALAVGTLAGSDRVIWFVPGAQGGPTEGQESLRSLLPRWVGWVVLQLFLVVAVCMLWRGRRLGRLVPEPLPVLVRAVETTEGRARMYRRSRAHGRAAATLRASALARLRQRTGLPRGATPSETAAVVAARTGVPAADVTALLSGPPPSDDAGLVRLAQRLDQLDREVRRP
ncbi:MAG: DUF4350 domain-containing protein [Actinomycetales bacterium]